MKRLCVLLLLVLLLPSLAQARSSVPLSPQARKDLNAFCTAFAQANTKSFDQATLHDEDMLTFAVWHCIMRADPALKRVHNGNDIVIPSGVIDTITQAYFARTIKTHHKAEYVESLASGEAFVFAQADSLRPRDDGTFQVSGTIYYTGSGETIDPDASRAAWKRAGVDVRVSGTFSGVLRRQDTGKVHWVLLQYTVKSAL